MVNWTLVNYAKEKGQTHLNVDCHQIGGSLDPRRRLWISRIWSDNKIQTLKFEIDVLERVLSITPQELVYPGASLKQPHLWQIVALNREVVLLMTRNYEEGKEFECIYMDDLARLKPIPDVWNLGTEEWALMAMYT